MEINDVSEFIAVKTREQLGVFVLDGSGSMDDPGEANCSLAESVNRRLKDFFPFFQNSRIKHEFQIAVISFDYEARVLMGRTLLTDVDVFQNFNPRDEAKDNPGTNIGAGLHLAKCIINEFFEAPNPDEYLRSVVIAILSDGMCQHPEKTQAIARELDTDPRIVISCGLYTTREREADKTYTSEDVKNFLQDIKSKAGIYGVIDSNEKLRQFFMASMSASKKKENRR
jgi:Mg-chelatase subunit ChlD